MKFPAHSRVPAILVIATLASAPLTAFPADWGDLKVRFVYGGNNVPPRPKLDVNKDQDVCGPLGLLDNSLVVDPKTKGIANVVVWLDEKKSGRELEVHESLSAAAEKPVILANAKCQFDPHVVTIRAGQTVKVTNEDPVAHAANFFFIRNTPIAAILPPTNAAENDYKIPKSEIVPIAVTCPIHAWMKAYVVVKDHPYSAVSNEKGELVLKNLPAGEWTFRVWHERVGYVDEVTVGGKPTVWDRGRFTVTIPAGKENDLGDVTIDAKAFEE